jgi:thiamine pyrophosphate-dependent acetolactate synthase large subunit-like protein
VIGILPRSEQFRDKAAQRARGVIRHRSRRDGLSSASNIDIPIVGDRKSVLEQLCEAVDARAADSFQAWRQKLADGEARKRIRAGGNCPTDGDVHPLGPARRSGRALSPSGSFSPILAHEIRLDLDAKMASRSGGPHA